MTENNFIPVESVNEEMISNFTKEIQRHINCLNSDNRNTRKKSLDVIDSELSKYSFTTEDFENLFCRVLIKPILTMFQDKVEKCRELAIILIVKGLKLAHSPSSFLPYIMPVLVQRLGQQDIVEPSEEIRLQLMSLIKLIIEVCKKNVSPYVDDFTKILVRTILDPYSDLKKLSCENAAIIAQIIPETFHLQSDSLIKPLLTILTHQHSKVRVTSVQTIGTVLQYGNGKSVSDVVLHLAQRLFDSVPAVRLAVIQVAGNWLLDLPDRYSYHYKLMPLLLTGLNDEILEISKEADSLWSDVGLKYESENESELKDKIDFALPPPQHYPAKVERPNLGCRQLVYQHFSKILPALVADLGDWVVSTRIKSAQLLYILLINEESNVTQHLDKVLSGLFKASGDEEKIVQDYVSKSAELIGYFVMPNIWSKMIFDNIKFSQSVGSLSILSEIIRGSQRSLLKDYLSETCNVISDPGILHVSDTKLQQALLNCVSSIIQVCLEDCELVSFELFFILLSIIGLQKKDIIKEQAEELLERLSKVQSFNDKNILISKHVDDTIKLLTKICNDWNQHSTDLFLFEALIFLAGSNIKTCFKEVMNIFEISLNKTKSPEVRLRFFAMLSYLMTYFKELYQQNENPNIIKKIVNDMILPNFVWSAGRTAEVIRKSAIACFWNMIQEQHVTKDMLLTIGSPLVIQLRSLLEDDNKGTRLISCKVLSHVFLIIGDSLEKDNALYNMYPDLLKRLDDSSDQIRIAASETFSSYLGCMRPQYDVNLYSGHLEEIFKGILIHLDDTNKEIQQSIYETIERTAYLEPDMLLKLIEKVKYKHRSTYYLDKLIDHIHQLPKPE